MKNVLLTLFLLQIICLSSAVVLKSRRHHQKKHNGLPSGSLYSFLQGMRYADQEMKQNKKASFADSMHNFRFKSKIDAESHSTEGMTLKALARIQSDDGVLDGPIYKRGWAKFIMYDPSKGEPDLKFYQNLAFLEQQKKPHDEEAEDDFGEVEIPSITSFFFVIGDQGIFALSSRRNDLTRTVKSLPISVIKPVIMKRNGYSGGVEELGNFREGFCWKVNAMVEGNDLTWIMCTNDLFEKEAWMKIIQLVKDKFTSFTQEKSLEGTATLGGDAFKTTAEQYDQTGPEGEAINTKINKAPLTGIDGYWVPLQDWSSCTLACGGGTRTLHQKCIPPLEGGKDCVGEPIMTEPCNEDPCPQESGGTTTAPDLPLKVKIMRVSERPQTYETCIIKEGDLEIIRDDLVQFVRPPRVPARVVLNNMTLSVFQTVSYDDILFTAELNDLAISKYEDDEACFVATSESTGKAVTLCSLGSISHISPKENRDEWVKQIGFFRNNCHTKLPVEQPDMDIADIKKQEAELEAEDAVATAQSSSSGGGAEQKQAQVAQMAVDAMAKEAKYEKLAEKEELDREVMMELEDRKKLEQMKAAEECMERDKRKAEAEAKGAGAEEGAKAQCDEMKGEIKNMIMNQRAQASKKIAMMKKMADKKRREALGDIQAMRLKMAKEAMASVKKGDITKCDPEQSKTEKTKYCNENFDTDPDANKDCKDPEQFCMMCCENEVGLKFKSERNACLAKCGDQSCSKNGNWVWVPEGNAVKV